MRTNLIVTFEEKDKVRSLGAKWDSVRKIWFIENVENIEKFLPWIDAKLKKRPFRQKQKNQKNK